MGEPPFGAALSLFGLSLSGVMVADASYAGGEPDIEACRELPAGAPSFASLLAEIGAPAIPFAACAKSLVCVEIPGRAPDLARAHRPQIHVARKNRAIPAS
jgi:hypothetical protein